MTLDRVPWFGRHVENLSDVIMYPVLARTGGKERARRKKGGEEKKKQWLHSLFLKYGYFGESFWPKKMLLNGKGPFAGNLFINRLEDSAMNSADLQNVPF